MASYVAFLRGVNVGGNRRLQMADVRRAFERLGFAKVRTLLASGNVLFESPRKDVRGLARAIEQGLAKACGMEVSVILRTRGELEKLLAADPFRGIRVTPLTRLFVTFLDEKPPSKLKIPYLSPDKSYRILYLRDRNLCSVLRLGPQWGRNMRQMDILEKEFGKRITTRSWSTVGKCVTG
jgi:uncharacterized protein (DUF1697 family)